MGVALIHLSSPHSEVFWVRNERVWLGLGYLISSSEDLGQRGGRQADVPSVLPGRFPLPLCVFVPLILWASYCLSSINCVFSKLFALVHKEKCLSCDTFLSRSFKAGALLFNNTLKRLSFFPPNNECQREPRPVLKEENTKTLCQCEKKKSLYFIEITLVFSNEKGDYYFRQFFQSLNCHWLNSPWPQGKWISARKMKSLYSFFSPFHSKSNPNSHLYCKSLLWRSHKQYLLPLPGCSQGRAFL